MDATKYCQFTDFALGTSPLTGRELRRNTHPSKIYLNSESDFTAYSPALQRVRPFLLPRRAGGRGPLGQLVRAFSSVCESLSIYELAKAVDSLIEVGRTLETIRGQKGFVLEFLYGLWADGLLAMPSEPIFEMQVHLMPGKIEFGRIQPICDALIAGSRRNRDNQVIGSFLRIAGSTMGIQDAGDIHPNTIIPVGTDKLRSGHLAKLVDGLAVVHRAKFGDQVPNKEDWGLGRKKTKSIEYDFMWVVEADPEMEEWRSKIREWMLGKKRGVSLRTNLINRFFAYMLEYPQLPRNIALYCHRETVLCATWAGWAERQQWCTANLHNYTNYLSEFVDWYLHTYLTAEDDYGRPVSSPLHWNPVSRLGNWASNKKASTHRDALPMRYLHELQDILTAENYKWPKTLKSDWFRRINPSTGETENHWSPVRAYAILLKLLLPLRTHQVRMLDSGEADSMVFAKGAWSKNNSHLSPARRLNARQGFLREFHDAQSGRNFTGFFVNTNKTADIYKDNVDKGYEIPWEHEAVIALGSELREWQSEFNPLRAPTRWADVSDKGLMRSNTPEMLLSRGTACFLFRDICGVHPADPVRDGRLQTFWAQLLQELERRVASRGEVLPDGSPLRFTEIQKSNQFPRGLYDLHTLRVSLITAFAVDGGVPLHILSKCVAGHATILMTLYYTKPGPAHINEVLAAAQQKLQRQEQTNFVRFLQNAEIAAAKPIVAFNDMAALEATAQSEPSGWSIGEIGICPVSGSKCNEGGSTFLKGKNGPVPGGPRNCVRCRFFVTGPAFLGGLVEKFNAIGFRLSEQSESVQITEKQIRTLEDAGSGSASADIASAYDRRESILAKIDESAHDWHACYALIQRCKEILKLKRGSGVDLVLAGSAGDLETAARECSKFDLVDRICQCATIYPSDITPHANIRRAKLIDSMLIRNGRNALFVTLSDEEMLSVGNAFVSLLGARLNTGDLNALIAGQLTLIESGVQESVDALIKLQSGQTYSGKALLGAIQNQIENERFHVN